MFLGWGINGKDNVDCEAVGANCVRPQRIAKRRCCYGARSGSEAPKGLFPLCLCRFCEAPLNLPPTLTSIIHSRRRGGNLPVPQRIAKRRWSAGFQPAPKANADCEATVMERGAAAKLRRVVFLFAVVVKGKQNLEFSTFACCLWALVFCVDASSQERSHSRWLCIATLLLA